MATSQNPNPKRRRPAVGGGSATGAPTRPGAGPTPDSTTEHDTGHPNVRGTLPMASPSPTTATADGPTSSIGDGAPQPAPQPAPHHRAATLPREVDDPAIDAALDAVVADAPPLPYEVRARLAWLLRGRHRHAGHDRAA